MTVAVILTDYKEAQEIINEDSNDKRLYELRLDCDEKLLLLVDAGIISPTRMILTVRSQEEGGKIRDHNKRKELILQSLKLQVGYLDLELNSDLDLIKEIILNPKMMKSLKLIISQHDHSEGSIDKYNEFYKICKSLIGAESNLQNKIVLKHVSKPVDAYEIYELLKLAPTSPKHILLGLGKNGEISRTLHSQLDQEFVFGSTNDSKILSYSLLENLTHTNKVMLGLIGHHLEHSLSPRIQQIFLDNVQQFGYYHLLEVNNPQRANQLITGLFELDFSGLNITFPYKTSVLDILDNISEEAANIRAVNTIKEVNGKLNGFNTDISGFSNFLREHNLHKLDSAIVIGAGGASRAITQSLIQENINVQVVTRSTRGHEHFKGDLDSQISLKIKSEISERLKGDIYINATPLGLKGEDPRGFIELPKNVKVVVDLLYDKKDTKFIRGVKQQGIEAYDGKEMLFNQAFDSFKIWTDVKLERKQLFNQFLKEVQAN
ncbi:MAG: type I 3-dehydroquinate dehydratase [Candidatus Heimdallarchaeota archaeon]|nr:type I 3-dehydroquinate dehydratase [Candidatus Heimdallarchaeota archaeon]